MRAASDAAGAAHAAAAAGDVCRWAESHGAGVQALCGWGVHGLGGQALQQHTQHPSPPPTTPTSCTPHAAPLQADAFEAANPGASGRHSVQTSTRHTGDATGAGTGIASVLHQQQGGGGCPFSLQEQQQMRQGHGHGAHMMDDSGAASFYLDQSYSTLGPGGFGSEAAGYSCASSQSGNSG